MSANQEATNKYLAFESMPNHGNSLKPLRQSAKIPFVTMHVTWLDRLGKAYSAFKCSEKMYSICLPKMSDNTVSAIVLMALLTGALRLNDTRPSVFSRNQSCI